MAKSASVVDLKKSQIAFIEDFMAYPNGRGYVLDFSDKTIAEYFEDEFRIDFYDDKYAGRGTSKRNRLIAFLLEEDAYTAANVLRSLWEHREGMLDRHRAIPVAPSIQQSDFPDDDRTKNQYFAILASIEH